MKHWIYYHENQLWGFRLQRPDQWYYGEDDGHGSTDTNVGALADDIELWLQSKDALIDEPEFKEGDIYYAKPNAIPVEIGEYEPWQEFKLKHPFPLTIKEQMQGHYRKFYSHFKEGQQYETEYIENGQPMNIVNKSGRAFNGAHRDSGKLSHVISGVEQRGWWGGISICGQEPGPKSNGWHLSHLSTVTCQKCHDKLLKKKDNGIVKLKIIS